MIKWQDAIREARLLIGTPYGEMDCINLIKKVIRTAQGGVPGYTTAGTNTLWKSYEASAKYRDLTWRQEGIAGAKAGMIAFKHSGEDYHHAGIVTDVGTVIHSSSTQGGIGVIETPLTAREGWNALAVHIYISTAEKEEPAMYKARVDLISSKSSLNLRNGPSTKDRVIGTIPYGETVDVLAEGKDWTYVRYGGLSGYVATEYLERTGEEVEEPVDVPEETGAVTIVDEAGNEFKPVGSFRVLIGGAD